MYNNQNIYDNEEFFEGYKKLRENPDNANNIEENPALMSLCPDLMGKTVLDLGCGYGGSCRRFAEMGAQSVVGVDISKKMLEIANTKNLLDNIQYFNMDMTEIDKLDMKFDVVFSSLALHYVEDFKLLLQRIHVSLNEGGQFIFSQEHPLTTAPINGVVWTRDELGEAVHYNLSDYCRSGERKVFWFVDEIKIFHRCISEIVNELIDAGFVIERMLEPFPDEEFVEKYGPHHRKGIHKPNFLLIKAVKKEG